ncbi:hypothetical protein [Aquibacillus sediminis]|uniref:hypothetical protein n=1 Tax=Aquibacillus sediminis TaxID=2574734 RepID=UPI001108572C|nr:hypothetical protein [Aquibacillus sediminis]
MNSKGLWLGIGLIIISWIANYIYFQTHQLEQPIFLDHYYGRQIEQEETHLPFHYLTNKQNPLEVQYIQVDDVQLYPVDNQSFGVWQATQPQIQYEQEFRHHYLKKVNVNVPSNVIPISEDNPSWSFEQMQVYFTDGSVTNATVGKVRLYNRLNNESVLEFRSGSSSNQHRESTSLMTTEEIRIDAIDVPFAEISNEVAIKVDVEQEKLQELEEIKQNGERPDWHKRDFEVPWEEVPGITIDDEVFPLEMERDEALRLFMRFNPNRVSYFHFGIEMVGETKSGEPFVTETFIHDLPYLEQDDINQIIDEKQGGRS